MKLLAWPAALVLFAGSQFAAGDSFAGTTCVDPGHTPTSLSGALNNWANTPGDAAVKVAGGTYPISILAIPFGNTGGALTVYGGYKPNTNCDDNQRNILSYPTVLDGGGTGYFILEPDGPLVIDGLTFGNFSGADAGYGSGVTFTTTSSSMTLTRFIANHDSTFVLRNGGDAPPNIVVQNCLVYNQPVNVTDPAMHVAIADGSATISNCTVTDNVGSGLLMETFDSAQINVYNTIAFNNGSPDFLGSASNSNTPDVYFSLYETANYVNAVSSIVPISNYTLFAGAGDFHLAQKSLAIDAGDLGLGYPANETDLDGNPRVVGNSVDIGAYESSYLPNQYVVTLNGDDGSVGTLRWAVAQANANPNPSSTIVFNISGTCPQTITLSGPTLEITQPVLIDGRTQPGWVRNGSIGAFDGTLCVKIATSSPGIALHTASGATASQLDVEGLMFAGFGQEAIKLEGGSGHRIGGNWFGGPSLAANHIGIDVAGNAGSTQIGGADPAFANVFGNSPSSAIRLENASGNNLVENNVIGIAPDGVTAEGNGSGIFVSYSPDNTIRANYIGNSTATLSGAIVLYGLASTGNILQQNFIGWDYYGSLNQPNAGAGIFVGNGAHDNIIGSNFGALNLGNSIRNSANPGVWLSSSAGDGNSVLANDLVGNGGGSALAIDLGGTGADANVTQGAQNYPVITNSFALANKQLVKGTLDAAPNTAYRLDFYYLHTPPGAPSGRGDAGLATGFAFAFTDANGHCSFLAPLAQVQVGAWFSGTATPVPGNTSEIGNAVAVQTDALFAAGFGGATYLNVCQ